MAVCNIHSQSYDISRNEYCVLCGDPKKRYYHIREVAERLGVHVNTARDWFRQEKTGVIPISVGYRRGVEHRTTLRVSGEAIERVSRRLEKGGV